MAKIFRKVLPRQKAGTAAKWAHALLTQSFYVVSRRYPEQMKRFLRKGLERAARRVRHRHSFHPA